MTTKAILVDIDGTLADVDHRLHFIRGTEREGKGKKDWHSFHDQCIHDQPNLWCMELVKIYKENGFTIILLTGRGEDYRKQTLTWLSQHNIPFDELHMRAKTTHLADYEVKKETYEKEIAPKYNIRFVLEDRASVVAMWREIGLTCLQCAPGDF